MRRSVTNPKTLARMDRGQIMATGKDLHGCTVPRIVAELNRDLTEMQAAIDKNKERHAKLNRWMDICSMNDPETIAEAKQVAKQGICRDCNNPDWRDCNVRSSCEGFKKEVGDILKEWAEE